MRTIVATVNVSESGSFQRLVLTDTSIYERHDTLSVYGSPYLGEFENSEDWRAAMAAYVTETASDYLAARNRSDNCHGSRLAYVDPQCAVYVWEIDFDN